MSINIMIFILASVNLLFSFKFGYKFNMFAAGWCFSYVFFALLW